MGAVRIYCNECKSDVTEQFIKDYNNPWFDLGKMLEKLLFSDVACPECAPQRRRKDFEIIDTA
jgi:hypothetical protein